jgi:hypothetical protein
VRVCAGALQGLEGLVIRKKGACRLVLSISLIHQSVAVEIDAELLQVLRPAVQVIPQEKTNAAILGNSRQPILHPAS